MGHLYTSLAAVFAFFLTACSDPNQAQYQQDYAYWMKLRETVVDVRPEELRGIWMLASDNFLYKDKVDEKYNHAVSTKYPKSGHLLIIDDNRILKSSVRLSCPAPKDPVKADWMIGLGLDPSDIEQSTSLNIDHFLELAQEKAPEKWDTLQISGQNVRTGRKLRGIEDAKEAKTIPYEIRITGLIGGRLDLYYFDESAINGGIHSIIEVYRKLDAREFTNLLKESRELAPCK